MGQFWDEFFDLSTIRGSVASSIIITVVLSIVIILLSFKIRKVNPENKTPKWLVPIMALVEMINNFVKQNIGKRWKSYSPWFLAIAIFIFTSNIAGLFLLESPTSYVVITMALAITTFFIIQGTGIASKGVGGYIKGFFEPVFIMLPMNLVSEISLPLSLALRLFGNIVSGMVIGILIKGFLGWLAIPVLPIVNIIFDIAFGLIQTVVFILLSVIFTSMKVDDKEKIYN